MTLDWLAQLLGLPPGWHGHLEDGASTGTLAAIAAARAARPGARVVVCSEHAHSSVEKACRMLGLEVRATPVDDAFRLRPDALDLTGACAVVATIGTTSTSSIDPVPAIADACEEAGVWLHVDAAYAGSAAVCPELREAHAGWERADSVVVNPHKWLSTPMGCSALWTRRPDDLRAAFSLVPEYLRVSEDVASLSEYSPALGRQFRALKLWTVLRCYGREGLQQRIREAVALAALFEGWVRDEPGWELAAPRPFSLVCFRREGTRCGKRDAARARERDGRALHLAHEAERPLHAAPGGRQRAHDRGRRAPRLGGSQAGSSGSVGAKPSSSRSSTSRSPAIRTPSALAVDDEVVEADSVRLDQHVVLLDDPGDDLAVDERRLLVADPEGERARRGTGERARSRASSSQPGSRASSGGGPISRAPKRASSWSTGRSFRPATVSS